MPKFLPTLFRSTAIALSASLLLTSAALPLAYGVTENPSLNLKDLGSTDNFVIPGKLVEIPMSFAVPEGTTPRSLSGTLQLPAEYSGGTLEVYQNGRIYSSVPLVKENDTVAVVVPLEGISVVNDSADFTVRVVMDVTDEQWCFDDSEMRLIDSSVQFEGVTRNPEVVADFLPPVLNRLSIFVPAQSPASVQEATLEVATSLASVYQNQSLDVEVFPLPVGSDTPPSAPGDFERQIVLIDSSNNEEGSMELVNPGSDDLFLRLRGDGAALYDQARLLTDSLLPLAAGTDVRASGLGDVPDFSTDSASLADLDVSNLSSESVARTTVRIGIERSRLRSFVESLDVYLSGIYTPLPTDSNGQITVSVGDTIVDSFSADGTGVIDRKFNVPGELVDRFTELVVEFRTTGDVSCGHTQPVGLNIDSASTITSNNTDTPVLTGFSALPQAFQPNVDVAMSAGDVADLSRAVRVLIGVQALSSQRIRPNLSNWDEAVASTRSTIFIDAEGSKARDLPSYLHKTDNTLIVTDGLSQSSDNDQLIRGLQSNVDLAVGAIQVMWDPEVSRIILVASSADSSPQLDGLLDWLDEDQARWYGLSGDILVRTLDREPVELDVVDAPEQPTAKVNMWIASAIALLVIMVVVAISILASKRAKRNQLEKQSAALSTHSK